MDSASETGSLENVVTVGIKHTSNFPRRRIMLGLLLQSVREHCGPAVPVLVADDGGAPDRAALAAAGASYIELPAFSGLSHGRNAIVRATRTPFVALMDDDVVFHASTSLGTLLNALRGSPRAALAGGCYYDMRFGRRDCFNLRFDADEGGTVVRAKPVPTPRNRAPSSCHAADVRWPAEREREREREGPHAHCTAQALALRACRSATRPIEPTSPVQATHNFFLARTAVLKRFAWDPRQRVMEHESFFYQLFLNQQPVLACPDVDVLHNTTRDEEYRERSFRLKENRFMQYHCKNFPELARFHTPYLHWRCDVRKYCVPVWRAQFAYDGSECVNMQWTGSDRSMASLPLVAEPIHPADRFPTRPEAPSGLPHVPLLVLIFTQRENVARRERQRATWLSFKWHSSHLSHELTPWRYLYVLGRAPASSARPRDASGGSQQIDTLVEARAEELLDQVVGDEVTLSAVTEGYENLVYKTLEAVRWALAHTSFDVLLKTDDDTVVHVGRLWMWLTSENRGPLARLYAGRVFPGSQVIRANFSRSDLWHPSWFPGDFTKWAVDFDVYAGNTYPTYCSGGGYVLGREASTLIVRAYDALPRKKVIPVEDAFVGVLAHSMGIEPTAAPNFQDPPRGSLQTRDNFIDQVLVHRVVVRCLVSEPLPAEYAIAI